MLKPIKLDDHMKDPAEATRNAEKARKDEGLGFADDDGEGAAWLIEALIETLPRDKGNTLS
jgi:hypothetical protein